MATLNKLVAELNGSVKLVRVQEQLGSTPQRVNQLKCSIVASLCEMVKTLIEPLTSDSATMVLELVITTPFDHTHKTQLSDAIEAKLLRSRVVDALSSTDKQGWGNYKSTVLSYFTAKDWEIMGNTDTAFNDHAKIMCAVGRLVRGGMLKPSPPVCADIIAALAAAAWTGSVDEVLLYTEVHNLSQTFASLEIDPSINDLPIVRKWPDSPHDLPSEVARAMYPDPADQPVVVAIQMFTKVRKVTSCRNTKTVIRDKVKPKSQSSALVVAHPPQVHPGAGVQSTVFAANIGALLQTAQAIGLNPTQLAQMGAQLLMQGVQPADRPEPVSECGLKFFDKGAPRRSTGGEGHSSSLGSPSQAGSGDSPSVPPNSPSLPALRAPEENRGHILPHLVGDTSAAALQSLDLHGSLGRKAKKADDDAKKTVELMEAEHQVLLAKAKEAAAAEKARGAAAAAAAATTDKRGKKRKATAGNAAVAMKRPAAKTTAADAKARPSKPDQGSVLHLGGRILIAPTRKAWRVWPNTDRVTIEKQVAFGKCMDTSFGLACGLIDAYWKAHKK